VREEQTLHLWKLELGHFTVWLEEESGTGAHENEGQQN
jgi:hypothetical protein